MVLQEDGIIRQLTPIEWERLQGFPEINERILFEICLDQAKINASAEEKNHRSQKPVGNAEKDSAQENVLFVGQSLSISNLPTNKHAQPDVRIYCEENLAEIHSQGKLLLHVSCVENKNVYHQLMQVENIALLIVSIKQIAERIIHSGKAALHQKEHCLTHQKNGNRLVRMYGKEIMQLAQFAEKDLITLKKHLKSTMLNHLNTEKPEQKLTILFLSVINAIIGYIPKQILNTPILRVEFIIKHGWTKYGMFDGEVKEISDTQRYKMIGNAVSVPVVQAIGTRIKEWIRFL